MSSDTPNRMLDVIYEAAALPEMWPGVLHELAEMVGGLGTILLTTDPLSLRWTCSEPVREVFLEFLEGRWHERNPRMGRLMANRHAGFIREIDLFTADEMDNDPTFQEFLRPRGLFWAAGTVVQVPSEDMLAFSIERRFADGPVEDRHLDAERIAASSRTGGLDVRAVTARSRSGNGRISQPNGVAVGGSARRRQGRRHQPAF